MLLPTSHRSAALWSIALLFCAASAAADGNAVDSDRAHFHRAASPAAAEFDGGRPAFAVLEAMVANWDGGVRPDGWIAQVQVFDDRGRPVAFSGSATFELVPRVPSADHTRFVAVRGRRLRWTTMLASDADCCATVRLPLRRSLPRTPIGHIPYSGVMRVRVAVPTEGVYEAESGVAINPPGLVDTLWKAR